MPIASAAASWAGSSSRFSTRSVTTNSINTSNRRNNNDNSMRMKDNSNSNSNSDSNSNSNSPQSPRVAPSYSIGEDEDSMEGIVWFRHVCGEIADDERSQMFILVLIAVNSAMIGMATFPMIKDDPTISHVFEVVDLVVLIIFSIESLVHFIFNGFRRFFRDGWLVFDLVIVIISWVSYEIDSLQAFRVFRALRFVTQVAILRNIIVAVFSMVPAITAIFTLLLLIFYIFAVMFTTLFKDAYANGDTQVNYFGRIDYTLFTLFQILCLDEWSGIAFDLREVEPWSWVIFVWFVVMSAFVVVNLLIAVICDALQVLRTAEDAMLEMAEEEDAAGEGEDDGLEMSNARMRRKVAEMQLVLDEMTSTQEVMARTIRRLSVDLHAERKPDELLSIMEATSDDAIHSNGGEGVVDS